MPELPRHYFRYFQLLQQHANGHVWLASCGVLFAFSSDVRSTSNHCSSYKPLRSGRNIIRTRRTPWANFRALSPQDAARWRVTQQSKNKVQARHNCTAAYCTDSCKLRTSYFCRRSAKLFGGVMACLLSGMTKHRRLSWSAIAVQFCQTTQTDNCHTSECCQHNRSTTHYTRPFNGPLSWLPGWAGTRNVKPVRILLKQETVSGSGISWAICKSAPRCRQVTMPAPHHSVFLQAGCPSCYPANGNQSIEGKNRTITVLKLLIYYIAKQLQCLHI